MGVNSPSLEQSITPTTGQGIRVTIPTTFRRASDSPDYVVIEGSSNSGSNYTVLAIAYLKDSNGNDLSLPLDVNLNNPGLLNPDLTVNNLTALTSLPPTNFINGKRVFVTSESSYFSYQASYPLPVNNIGVVSSSSSGVWVKENSRTVFVSDLEGLGGVYGSPLTSIGIVPFAYEEDLTDSYPLTLLLRNGFDNNQALIPTGTLIGLRPFIDGNPSPNLLQGKVRIQLIGFIDPINGTFTSSGSPMITFDATRSNQLALPTDLQSGHAAVYKVYLNYAAISLSNISPFSKITFELFIYSQNGIDAPWTAFTGNFASQEGDQRRALPSFGNSVLVGSGVVAVNGLISPSLPRETISGLLPNSNSQTAYIDGNGLPVISNTPFQFDTLWATLGSQAGLSELVDFGSVNLTSLDSIEISIDHPIDINGDGIIRSDYSDLTIRGKNADFNPSKIYIFLDDGIDTYLTEVNPTLTANQIVTISALGTVETPLEVVSTSFGFYVPVLDSLNLTGSGSIPVGTYQVLVGYYYDGNTLSSISNQLKILNDLNVSVSSITVFRSSNLTSNLILDSNSARNNYIGGTVDLDVILDDPATIGTLRVIKNITPLTALYSVKASLSGSTEFTLGDGGTGTQAECVYDGVEWQITII